MVNPSNSIGSAFGKDFLNPKVGGGGIQKPGFSETAQKAVGQVSKVDQMQQSSDVSIIDLLTSKNEDITSVISSVAKADMSFKLLVGVRNKLVEAYKQTMNMQI